MPWGKKDDEPEEADEAPEEIEEGPPSLERPCHICEKTVDSRVWYAKTIEEGKRKDKHDKRVFACPTCYFELHEEERASYFRERL